MYYRLGTARYQPITTDHGIVLRKAGAQGPRVGDTRIEGGKAQRFNENHRWENVKEAPGQMNLFGGLATVQDAPTKNDLKPGYYEIGGQRYVDLNEVLASGGSDAFQSAIVDIYGSENPPTVIIDRNRHIIDPTYQYAPPPLVDEYGREVGAPAFENQTEKQQDALFELHGEIMPRIEESLSNGEWIDSDELSYLNETLAALGYELGTQPYDLQTKRYWADLENDEVPEDEKAESGETMQQRERHFAEHIVPKLSKQIEWQKVNFPLEEFIDEIEPLNHEFFDATAILPWMEYHSESLPFPTDLFAELEPYRKEYPPPELVERAIDVLKDAIKNVGYVPQTKKEAELLSNWDEVSRRVHASWANYLADDE